MAAATVTTREGDVVDQLALAAYGRLPGATEAVLAANPQLDAYGPVLPAGLVLLLPAIDRPRRVAVVRLWD